MTLDPQAKAYLDQLAAARIPDVSTLTVREARAQMDLGSLMLGRPPKVAKVDDLAIEGPGGALRVRVTRPEGEGEGPFAALVFFHGGGWVSGGLASHDSLCRALTNAGNVVVVAVDYRLAPEHPFPAAVDDCQAATSWTAANAGSLGIDRDRLAVGGDSAGGNLAAVVARRARDGGGPKLAFQLLLYPATVADLDSASYLENAEGYFLTRAAMAWYWAHYVPDARMRDHPDASPLRAHDLSGLPPALIVTAGYDPLRDEGETYGRRLDEAGVNVQVVRREGMIHGFLRRHTAFDEGRATLDLIGRALQEALGRPESI